MDGAPSCVAPVLGTAADPQPVRGGNWPSLGQVKQGQQLTVFGKWYFAGPCRDTTTAGAAPPSAAPATDVTLSLHTSDGGWHQLATAHPDENSDLAATVQIPADATPGPATINDGRRDQLTLVIVAARGGH